MRLTRQARDEIADRQKEWGSVPPRRLAEWIKRHKDSALYGIAKAEGCFDPKRAMEAHLISVCQQCIRLVITVEHGVETRQYVSLLQDRGKGLPGYRSVNEVLENSDLRHQMVAQFVVEMEALERRYRRFVELSKIFDELDAVREQFPKSRRKTEAERPRPSA